MEMNLQTLLFSTDLKSKRRKGTLNQGNNYEIKICALMALRFLNSNDIKNFFITQNIDNPLIGDFDDVILSIEKQNGEMVTYCMQLKHFGEVERKKKLNYETFHKEATKNTKSPFNLAAYYNRVKNAHIKLEKSLKGNSFGDMKYVLFTNKECNEMEDRFVTYKNSETDLINIGGRSFHFEEYKYPKYMNSAAHQIYDEIDSSFLNKLIVLCKQQHEENLYCVIGRTIQKLFNLDALQVDEIVTKYIDHFTNWANGLYGGDRSITKDEITFKLGEFLLHPYIYHFRNRINNIPDDDVLIWNNVIKNYDIVILDEYEMSKEFCQDYESLVSKAVQSILHRYSPVDDWHSEFGTEDENKLFEHCKDLNAATEMKGLWGSTNFKKINLRKVYTFLCKKNILPLVLHISDEEQLRNVLNIAQFTSGKFVLLYEKAQKEAANTNRIILQNFLDLNENDKEVIYRLNMKLQGRTVQVKDVLWHKDLKIKLSTKHIAQIILRTFNIGDNHPNLPEIFVDRTLENIIVNPNIFKTFIIYVLVCERYSIFEEYIAENNILIEKSNIYSFFSPSVSKQIKFLKKYKILVLNVDCLNDINEELKKYTSDEIAFKILHLKETDNKIELYSSDNSWKQTINIIVCSEREQFTAFLNKNCIRFDKTEIVEFPSSNEENLPFSCEYVTQIQHNNEINCLIKKYKHRANIHIFSLQEKINNTFELEWLASFGNGDEIKKFVIQVDVSCDNVGYKVENCFKYESFNLLCGSPGMGKSVLINYLEKHCPSHLWAIHVNFNDHGQYLRNNLLRKKSTLENLQYFINYTSLKSQEKCFIDKYIENKKICILFDGFDEISPEEESNICDFLHRLIKEDFIVFLTTRTVKVGFLELKFKIVARNINPFTEKDQFEYISQFYNNKITNNSNKINEFVTKLLAVTNKNMYAWDKEFAGIPLQTVMLSNIYLEECRKFCEQNIEVDSENVDVLFLYDQFIKLKIVHLETKDNFENTSYHEYFNIAMKRSLECHKICAIQSIFLTTPPGTDIGDFMTEIRTGRDKLGLIEKVTEEGIPIFVHRTFAEYLVAVFISENYQTLFTCDMIHKLFSNPIYDVIRNIMDRLLAKNSLIHKALLNRDELLFKELLEDEKAVQTLDCGGRTILHIGMSWGARHKIPDIEKLDDLGSEKDWFKFKDKLNNFYNNCRDAIGTEHFVHLILEKNDTLLFKEDKILAQNPLQYGIKVLALQNVDQYLKCIFKTDKKFVNAKEVLQSLFKYNVETLFSCCPLKRELKIEPRTDHKQLYFVTTLYDYSVIAIAIEKIKPIFSNVTKLKFGSGKITLLHLAALFKANKTIDILVDEGVRIDTIEQTMKRSPLHFATMLKNESTVKVLLERGAKSNKRDTLNFTPLYYASVYGYEELMETLANAERKTSGRKTKVTELYLATIAGKCDKVRALMVDGIDVNEESDGARTPLMSAADHGHYELVQLFLECGAQVNKINEMKWTALMYAAKRGYDDIVKLLLDSGANIYEVKNFEWDPIKLARANHHLDTVKLLEDFLINLGLRNFMEFQDNNLY